MSGVFNFGMKPKGLLNFHPLFLIIAEFLLIGVHSLLLSETLFLYLIRLLVGIVAFLYIPGYCLVSSFIKKPIFNNFGFYLTMGFLYQLLNIYVIWWISLIVKPINFALLLNLLTLSLVLTIISYSCLTRKTYRSTNLLGEGPDKELIFVLILFGFLASWFQNLSPSPHSDGAAYLDMARNIVKRSSFSSNMMLPETNWANVEYSTGRHIHFFGIWAIALFFHIGDISLLSAKIMLMFCGFLTIFLIYELCKKLFGKITALLATLITSISPEILAHVALVGGPEMVSLVHVLLLYYCIITVINTKRWKEFALISGLSFFILMYAWIFNFIVILLGPILIIFLIASYIRREINLGSILLFVTLLLAFLLDYRLTSLLTYKYLGVFVPTIIIAPLTAIYYYLKKEKGNLILKFFAATFLILYLLILLTSSSTYLMADLISKVDQEKTIAESNINLYIKHIDRLLDFQEIIKYNEMYWKGLKSSISETIIFLAMLSFFRIRKLWGTLTIASFPIFQWIIWDLIVIIDMFQPRFIIVTSAFWFILASSALSTIITITAQHKLIKSFRLSVYSRRQKLNFSGSSIFKSSAIFVSLLLLAMIPFQPIYNNMENVTKGWDFPSKFGWISAFEWVKRSTKPDDIIIARYGNYWAWYIERKIVSLSPSIYDPNMLGINEIIHLIQKYKARYLVVDYTLCLHFPKLKQLCENPKSLPGTEIVYTAETAQGYKVIIYNVTNLISRQKLNHQL